MTPRTRLKPLLTSLPFGPLAEREFRLLFIGRTISLFGSAFAPIALAFAVITLTGSPSDLGLVLSAYMLAHLAFQCLRRSLRRLSIDGNRDREAVFSDISRLIEDKIVA